MKVITSTVVRGRVSDELPFADGTAVLVVARDPRGTVRLAGDELAEVEAGIDEADHGELIDGDELLQEVGRLDRQ